MRERTKQMLKKIGLKESDFHPKESTSSDELEEAIVELAQSQSDLEDAICELAAMLTEVE